jgi:hypothetical protein
MKVINDIILNQSNQSSLDLGTTNEVSLNSTDNSTYQSVLSCSQVGTPAVEMQASDLGSTYSKVQVLNTGFLYIESGDGTNVNQIQMSPTTINIQTPTSLYQAQQNGNVEVRADGTLNLIADYQGNQPSVSMASNSIELNAGADAASYIKFLTQGLTTLAAYDDDAAAGTAGLTTGMIYQTTGLGAAPLDAAGIVMIKQ